MAKNNRNKDEANNIRDSLDALISDNQSLKEYETGSSELPQDSNDLNSTDFNQMFENTKDEAKNMMKKILNYYSKADIITNNEYLQARKKIEEMTLGSLLYQLRTAEVSMTQLVQQIDQGRSDPRMFEVLASIQKSLLEITKTITIQVNTSEHSLRHILREIEEQEEAAGNIESDDDQEALVSRGSKNLMENIHNDIQHDEPEESEENDEENDLDEELNEYLENDEDTQKIEDSNKENSNEENE